MRTTDDKKVADIPRVLDDGDGSSLEVAVVGGSSRVLRLLPFKIRTKVVDSGGLTEASRHRGLAIPGLAGLFSLLQEISLAVETRILCSTTKPKYCAVRQSNVMPSLPDRSF